MNEREIRKLFKDLRIPDDGTDEMKREGEYEFFRRDKNLRLLPLDV